MSADPIKSPPSVSGKEEERPNLPLTEDQLQAGLSEARRIINNSVGYWFANEIMPFDKAFKSLALRAIAQLEVPDVR